MLLLYAASSTYFCSYKKKNKKKSYYNFNGFITFVQTYSTSLLHNGKKIYNWQRRGRRMKYSSRKVAQENAQIQYNDMKRLNYL